MPEIITHPWEPIYDSESRILILGSIPSPKSREVGFYFGHPQNLFWTALAEALDVPTPAPDSESKRKFLLENHIALWDVLHSCEIEGASDISIRNPVPNKFRPLIEKTNIKAIFTTGKKATALFERYCTEESGMSPIYLPSTSPANRAMQCKPEFRKAWSQIREIIIAPPNRLFLI
ncbi:MAG: DNA-deoxyinosine glycosylase [Clostridiales Family XIII bacterium]|jgi:hypoxanthine-DNA glycosylase|nr:DNA-deoxyinosine glycosylase [Clostridiales Family XIII bacterium]